MRARLLTACGVPALAALRLFARAGAQAPAGEWRAHGGDLASRQYSPLTQVAEDTLPRLVAWQ